MTDGKMMTDGGAIFGEGGQMALPPGVGTGGSVIRGGKKRKSHKRKSHKKSKSHKRKSHKKSKSHKKKSPKRHHKKSGMSKKVMGGKRRVCPKYCRRKTVRCKTYRRAHKSHKKRSHKRR